MIKSEKQEELIRLLSEPFDPADIEWRIQRANKDNRSALVLAYIDNRAVTKRLNEVVGAFNWRNTKKQFKDGIVDQIEIRNPDNPEEWIHKEDGADPTDVEPFKGSMSDSMKRSAVLWGIGHYLYRLKSSKIQLMEGYNKDDGVYNIELKDPKDPAKKIWYYWFPPALPSWALPSNYSQTNKELELAKESTLQTISKYYSSGIVPEAIVKEVDSANNDDQLCLIDTREQERFKRVCKFRASIKAGWDKLGYEAKHITNSLNQKDADGNRLYHIDNIATCDDDVEMEKYYKHLLDNYDKKHKGGSND